MTGWTLRLAYVPLTDAAPLIVASEWGFAAEEEFALDLVLALSWAQLRGLLAAARAIGPCPSLPPVEVLIVLSSVGQAIGTSSALVSTVCHP